YEPSSFRDAIAEINSDLESVREWSVRHGLKLNAGKSTVLHIAPAAVLQILKEDSKQIERA
uniref:hypothetical protein n=1 Tax=Klebsiella pneumoniae TaxID=573 RepID=UPI001C8F86A6